MGWAALFLSLVGPILSRALVYLGFVSFAILGLDVAFDALITTVTTYWSALPAGVLQLASLAKVPEGLGIVLGAQAARVALWIKMNSVKFIVKK